MSTRAHTSRTSRSGTSRRRRRSWLATALASALVAPVAVLTATPTAAAPPDAPGSGKKEQEAGHHGRGFSELIGEKEHGRSAIAKLGPQIAKAAARNGMEVAELAALLREDSSVWVDTTGRLFYIDTLGHPERDAGTASSPSTAAAAPYPYAETFALSSRPGSKRTIYLDFNGQKVSGTGWNRSGVSTTPQPAFDLDGAPGSFNNAERDVIQDVWQRVSEDFAPFDVNVTTTDPGAAALRRTNLSDKVYGVRALITPAKAAANKLCGGWCSGIAYIGTFGDPDRAGKPDYFEPAWVFSHITRADPAAIAGTLTHEVGHNLGLKHDGLNNGTEYYPGKGAWAPIMGDHWYRPINHWSKGEYPGANNRQDDIAVMGKNGAALRPVDGDNSRGAATPLEGGSTLTGQGVITRASDKDYFKVSRPCPGTLTATALPTTAGPNLDIRLRVLDSSGVQLAVANPASKMINQWQVTGLDATASTPVSPGNYYLEVDGVGEGLVGGTGYSDYGSLGSYTISATGCGKPADPTSLTLNRSGAPESVTVTWEPPTNDGGYPVESYTVSLNGQRSTEVPAVATRSHTFTGLTAGANYTVGVAATNSVGTGPEATRSFTNTRPPSAPTNVAVDPEYDYNYAEMTWQPPASPGDFPVTGYVVQRSGVDRYGGTFEPQKVGAADRSFDFDGLKRGTEYTLSIHAVSEAGAGQAVTRTVTLVAPRVATAPLNVRATAGNEEVTLTWDAPSDPGTHAVDGYEARVFDSSGVNVNWDYTYGEGERSLTFRLDNGQPYTFKVRAYSYDAGNGAWATVGPVTPTG